MKTYPGINTLLLAIKNKFSRLSRKKAVSLTIVTVLLVLFPTQVILFANGLLEFTAVILGFIYAARWGLFDGEKVGSGAPSGGVYNYGSGEIDSGDEYGGLYDD